MPEPHRSTVRPARVRAGSALAGAVAGGIVAALAAVVVPAQGAEPFAIPVDCSVDKTVLELDDVSYDLNGTCGVVVVAASNTVVTMPAATKLVVRGAGNDVVAKPLTRVVVRGHGHTISTPSMRTLRLASPGSVVEVEGLLESATLAKRRGTVRADQVTELRVDGRQHRVRARRGYDARLAGDGAGVRYRRLDHLVVTGDENEVRVRRGRTSVRVDGSDNVIRVNRRG